MVEKEIASPSGNSFLQVHSHETVWSVKQKIASLLRVNAEQIMLVIGDRPSPQGIFQSIVY